MEHKYSTELNRSAVGITAIFNFIDVLKITLLSNDVLKSFKVTTTVSNSFKYLHFDRSILPLVIGCSIITVSNKCPIIIVNK